MNLLCRLGIHAPPWRGDHRDYYTRQTWLGARTCDRCGTQLATTGTMRRP